MYAASIVAFGVFVGAGDTLAPSVMNLASMWVVRLPAAWYLSTLMGLRGIWLAMACELGFRGIIFVARLARARWEDAEPGSKNANGKGENAAQESH